MPEEKPLKAGVGSSVAIAASWKRNRGTDRDNALAFYEVLFTTAASCPFLRGESDTDFRASMVWILGPKNELKVMSGFYKSDSEPKAQKLWTAQPPIPPPPAYRARSFSRCVPINDEFDDVTIDPSAPENGPVVYVNAMNTRVVAELTREQFFTEYKETTP